MPRIHISEYTKDYIKYEVLKDGFNLPRKWRRRRTPLRLLMAINTVAWRHRSLCKSDIFTVIMREFAMPHHVTEEDLRNIWARTQDLCMQMLRLSSRCGDVSSYALGTTTADIADLVLLYSNDDTIKSLLTPDSAASYEESKALYLLWQLVNKHGVEKVPINDKTAQEVAQRWTEVWMEYQDSNRVASIIVLQRRWYELKLQAREIVLSFWRSQKNINKATQETHTLDVNITQNNFHKTETSDKTTQDIVSATETNVKFVQDNDNTTKDVEMIHHNVTTIDSLVESTRDVQDVKNANTKQAASCVSDGEITMLPTPLHIVILQTYPKIATAPFKSWQQLIVQESDKVNTLDEDGTKDSDTDSIGFDITDEYSVKLSQPIERKKRSIFEELFGDSNDDDIPLHQPKRAKLCSRNKKSVLKKTSKTKSAVKEVSIEQENIDSTLNLEKNSDQNNKIPNNTDDTNIIQIQKVMGTNVQLNQTDSANCTDFSKADSQKSKMRTDLAGHASKTVPDTSIILTNSTNKMVVQMISNASNRKSNQTVNENNMETDEIGDIQNAAMETKTTRNGSEKAIDANDIFTNYTDVIATPIKSCNDNIKSNQGVSCIETNLMATSETALNVLELTTNKINVSINSTNVMLTQMATERNNTPFNQTVSENNMETDEICDIQNAAMETEITRNGSKKATDANDILINYTDVIAAPIKTSIKSNQVFDISCIETNHRHDVQITVGTSGTLANILKMTTDDINIALNDMLEQMAIENNNIQSNETVTENYMEIDKIGVGQNATIETEITRKDLKKATNANNILTNDTNGTTNLEVPIKTSNINIKSNQIQSDSCIETNDRCETKSIVEPKTTANVLKMTIDENNTMLTQMVTEHNNLQFDQNVSENNLQTDKTDVSQSASMETVSTENYLERKTNANNILVNDAESATVIVVPTETTTNVLEMTDKNNVPINSINIILPQIATEHVNIQLDQTISENNIQKGEIPDSQNVTMETVTTDIFLEKATNANNVLINNAEVHNNYNERHPQNTVVISQKSENGFKTTKYDNNRQINQTDDAIEAVQILLNNKYPESTETVSGNRIEIHKIGNSRYAEIGTKTLINRVDVTDTTGIPTTLVNIEVQYNQAISSVCHKVNKTCTALSAEKETDATVNKNNIQTNQTDATNTITKQVHIHNSVIESNQSVSNNNIESNNTSEVQNEIRIENTENQTNGTNTIEEPITTHNIDIQSQNENCTATFHNQTNQTSVNNGVIAITDDNRNSKIDTETTVNNLIIKNINNNIREIQTENRNDTETQMFTDNNNIQSNKAVNVKNIESNEMVKADNETLVMNNILTDEINNDDIKMVPDTNNTLSNQILGTYCKETYKRDDFQIMVSEITGNILNVTDKNGIQTNETFDVNNTHKAHLLSNNYIQTNQINATNTEVESQCSSKESDLKNMFFEIQDTTTFTQSENSDDYDSGNIDSKVLLINEEELIENHIKLKQLYINLPDDQVTYKVDPDDSVMIEATNIEIINSRPQSREALERSEIVSINKEKHIIKMFNFDPSDLRAEIIINDNSDENNVNIDCDDDDDQIWFKNINGCRLKNKLKFCEDSDEDDGSNESVTDYVITDEKDIRLRRDSKSSLMSENELDIDSNETGPKSTNDKKTKQGDERIDMLEIQQVRKDNSNIHSAEDTPIEPQNEKAALVDSTKGGGRDKSRNYAKALEKLRSVEESGGYFFSDSEDEADESVESLDLPSQKVLEDLLVQLIMNKINIVCCSAREHRYKNDTRKLQGLPELKIHKHDESECTCCCRHLCKPVTTSMPDLVRQSASLQEDISNILKISLNTRENNKRNNNGDCKRQAKRSVSNRKLEEENLDTDSSISTCSNSNNEKNSNTTDKNICINNNSHSNITNNQTVGTKKIKSNKSSQLNQSVIDVTLNPLNKTYDEWQTHKTSSPNIFLTENLTRSSTTLLNSKKNIRDSIIKLNKNIINIKKQNEDVNSHLNGNSNISDLAQKNFTSISNAFKPNHIILRPKAVKATLNLQTMSAAKEILNRRSTPKVNLISSQNIKLNSNTNTYETMSDIGMLQNNSNLSQGLMPQVITNSRFNIPGANIISNQTPLVTRNNFSHPKKIVSSQNNADHVASKFHSVRVSDATIHKYKTRSNFDTPQQQSVPKENTMFSNEWQQAQQPNLIPTPYMRALADSNPQSTVPQCGENSGFLLSHSNSLDIRNTSNLGSVYNLKQQQYPQSTIPQTVENYGFLLPHSNSPDIRNTLNLGPVFNQKLQHYPQSTIPQNVENAGILLPHSNSLDIRNTLNLGMVFNQNLHHSRKYALDNTVPAMFHQNTHVQDDPIQQKTNCPTLQNIPKQPPPSKSNYEENSYHTSVEYSLLGKNRPNTDANSHTYQKKQKRPNFKIPVGGPNSNSIDFLQRLRNEISKNSQTTYPVKILKTNFNSKLELVNLLRNHIFTNLQQKSKQNPGFIKQQILNHNGEKISLHKPNSNQYKSLSQSSISHGLVLNSETIKQKSNPNPESVQQIVNLKPGHNFEQKSNPLGLVHNSGHIPPKLNPDPEFVQQNSYPNSEEIPLQINTNLEKNVSPSNPFGSIRNFEDFQQKTSLNHEENLLQMTESKKTEHKMEQNKTQGQNCVSKQNSTLELTEARQTFHNSSKSKEYVAKSRKKSFVIDCKNRMDDSDVNFENEKPVFIVNKVMLTDDIIRGFQIETRYNKKQIKIQWPPFLPPNNHTRLRGLDTVEPKSILLRVDLSKKHFFEKSYLLLSNVTLKCTVPTYWTLTKLSKMERVTVDQKKFTPTDRNSEDNNCWYEVVTAVNTSIASLGATRSSRLYLLCLSSGELSPLSLSPANTSCDEANFMQPCYLKGQVPIQILKTLTANINNESGLKTRVQISTVNLDP